MLQPIPLYQNALAGLTAGGLGALVGSPADLSLIRMQSDSTLPAAQRRNYKGVGDALIRIVKEEGVGGLFTGAGPTVVRAMSLNMGMLASNEQACHPLDNHSSSMLTVPQQIGCPCLNVMAFHGFYRVSTNHLQAILCSSFIFCVRVKPLLCLVFLSSLCVYGPELSTTGPSCWPHK